MAKQGLRRDSESPPVPLGSIETESLQHLASYHCSIYADGAFNPPACSLHWSNRSNAVTVAIPMCGDEVSTQYMCVWGPVLFDWNQTCIIPKHRQVLVWHILL